MATYPKGNQFWKIRSKHGRDTLFATPELLLEAANEYFQWCVDNPIMRMEQSRNSKAVKDEDTGKYSWPDALIGIPTSKPFTIIGLALFLGASSGYWTNFKHGLRVKLSDEFILDNKLQPIESKVLEQQKAKDFLSIITHIEDTIYNQKFEGAAVGMYNSNIIARDLGLREGIDQKVTGNIHLSKEPTVFE